MQVAATGLLLGRPRGGEINAATWDAFFEFYHDTTCRKYGQAYLTRDFFHRMGHGVGDAVMLVTAAEAGAGSRSPLVGAALNLVRSINCRRITERRDHPFN